MTELCPGENNFVVDDFSPHKPQSFTFAVRMAGTLKAHSE